MVSSCQGSKGSELDSRGTLAGFLISKIGVAVAAFALIGMALSMRAGSSRFNERRQLEQVANTIARALESVDGLSGEIELRRNLNVGNLQLEVTLSGWRENDLQLIRVEVSSAVKIERVLILQASANGGDFRLSAKNPERVIVRKVNEIEVELV